MLSLSPRYDLIRFLLPKDFLPEEINQKWLEFFNREPGVVVTPIDYLNESIKGITLPGISDVNITQQQHSTNPIARENTNGKNLGRLNVEPNQNNTYVGASNPLALIDRKFTVTFRLNQGLYNYFMLYETLFHRICKHLLYQEGEDFIVDVLNEDGVAVSHIKLMQCHMDGIDGLEFSFDKVDRQSDSFNVVWTFNNIDMEFVAPEPIQ